ncbi:MAG: FecR domain-containing protein [Pseudomonas sp.]|nr:FecR domain-containing protein [Pseudomonas sp.]
MAAPLALQTLEAAATWYVRLNSARPTEADQQAWRHWLEASPQHARAWARVEKLQNQWAALPVEVSLSTLAGVQARRRATLKTLGLLLAVGGSGWLATEHLPYQAMLADQRTATGQRRRLVLDDGSQVDLNTDSAMDIAFSAELRLIRLHRGEILVQTAADSRPFIVQAPQGSVRALGTRFIVRCESTFTDVCVLDKAVELRPLNQPSRVLRLDAGQQAHFDREQVSAITPAPTGAGAWNRGMLTVIEWRLGDFIAELGRYRVGVLRCAPAIAHLRLSGAFRIDDTDTILENLSQSLPVNVHFVTRYWASVEAA